MDFYEVDVTTVKPHTRSRSLFLLKATVKAVLSVTAVQHTRTHLKTPNISTVYEGNELQTGRKSLQHLLTVSQCRDFLGECCNFSCHHLSPVYQVPSSQLRMYWMAGTFTLFSVFPI